MGSSLTSRLDLVLSRMSIHLPFIASVAMTMVPKLEKVGTACTNGVWVKFDPEFCDKLSDPELMYLYAHEAWHKAMLHPWRRGNRNHSIWNMACDYVINTNQNEMRNPMLKMPKDGLHNHKFLNMSEEQVYEQLVKDGVNPPPEYLIDLVEDDSTTLADAEIEILNIAKGCKMAGMSHRMIDIILGNAQRSRVRWEDVLREFITTNIRSGSTWKRRSRRSEGIYLPSLRSKVLRSMVLFGDFSGSMMEVVKKVVAEMQGVVDDVSPEITHVICGDTKVTFNRSFARGEKLEIKARGGGGTDFRPLFEAAEALDQPPDCAVFLTDTYGTFPSSPPVYPVLWGVVGATNVNVPWGEIVRVER